MKLLLIIFFIPFYSFFAQEKTDTISTPSHSIKKALILSAAIPGAGQIYNHIAMPKGRKTAFWKVPLIYAGLGATSYFLFKNQTITSELKQEYIQRQENGTGSPKWQSYDDQGILTLFESYQKKRDFSILGLAFVYILQVADAGVEAHFVTFDVSKDLSLKLKPTLLDYNKAGVSLTLNFKK